MNSKAKVNEFKRLIAISLYVLAFLVFVAGFFTFSVGLFLGLQIDPNLGNLAVVAALSLFLAAVVIAVLTTLWLTKSEKGRKKKKSR